MTIFDCIKWIKTACGWWKEKDWRWTKKHSLCIGLQSRSKVLSPVDEHFKLSTPKQSFLKPSYSKYRDGLTIIGIEGFLG